MMKALRQMKLVYIAMILLVSSMVFARTASQVTLTPQEEKTVRAALMEYGYSSSR